MLLVIVLVTNHGQIAGYFCSVHLCYSASQGNGELILVSIFIK